MKKILTLLALTLGFNLSHASPVSTVTANQTINGNVVSVTTAAPATPAYYRLTWMVVVRGGSDVNVLKSFIYSTGTTKDIDNMYCATTYAEMQTEATTLGITNLPPDPNARH